MFTSHGETANESPDGLLLFSRPFHAIAPLAVAIGELGQGQQPTTQFNIGYSGCKSNTLC